MALILAYHFNPSHTENDDLSENKNHVLKAKNVSCEGGACDEKNDHVHEHKKKKRLSKTIHYSHK